MGRAVRFVTVFALSLALERMASAQTDPGALGPRPWSSGDYGSFSQLAGVPGSNVELRARVYYPSTASGSETFPVVYFLHGDHATNCYNPSTGAVSDKWPCTPDQPIPHYTGFGYVGSILASYGIVVISISANGINAVPDSTSTGLVERVALIQKHIEWWGIANRNGAAPFGLTNRVDFSRMAVVGHSKGGHAVVRFATVNPPAGLRAVMSIAPTGSPGENPVVNKPFAMMLAYCDGDVSDLQGIGRVDKARYVNVDDEAPKYSFLVLGANHNFFNRTWTPGTGAEDFNPGSSDDSSGTDVHCSPTTGKRVTAAGQRYIANGYINAFLRKHLLGATQFEAVLKGDLALPAPPTNGAVMVGYIPGAHDRKEINSVLSSSARTVNELGGAVTVTCNGAACPATSPLFSASVCTTAACRSNSGTLIQRSTHFGSGGSLNALRLGWTNTGGRIANTLPDLDRDVSNFRTLQLRVAQLPYSTPPTSETSQDFSVVLRGTDGRESSVRAQNVSTELYYPPGGRKGIVMNTLRVPMSSFSNVNFSNIASIDLFMNRTTTGNLLVSDLALVDPVVYGFKASYSGLFTYGVQTGSAHNACNWTSTGQICTMPSSETIHYCYDSSFTSAAGRGLLEHDVPVFAAAVGVPTPIASFVDLGFKMVKHASCSDPEVQLIIDGAACSGTNSSSIKGYVCTTFPALTSDNELEVIANTPWPAPGSYYTWGRNGGRTTLHLDIADIINAANPVSVLKHAAYHGLGWIIGLGARTDNAFLYTSTNVANQKNGWTEAEACRARSFRRAADKDKFEIGVYCGPDS